MRWQAGRRSVNVEDRRGRGGMFIGGGIGAVVLTVIALLLGINPGDLTQDTSAPPAQENTQTATDEGSEFVRHVLGDTEDTWNEIFQQGGREYPEPKLVLFSGATQTACGFAQAAIGPFYCPNDQSVYIDLSFYDDLRSRFGASGDFAQAYVIAHEVGHHVQNVLGVLNNSGMRGAGSNEQSVRLELQADCLAGIWANHADVDRKMVESGDIEEALNAAAAIGDDRLQQRSQGYVVPESFTHGSSEQRVNAFRAGYQGGTLQACN
jgi:predicted metalloprotease